MIEVIAVRHGETDWNRLRRLQGHTDVGLNANGIEQASRLATALADQPIAAVHASDLARALATARPLAVPRGLPIATDARLRERHYGVLEGLLYADIATRHPLEAAAIESRDPSHTIEGGESQQRFHDRSVAVVQAIADAEERRHGDGATVLVVTHGGVLDMLFRAAHGVPLDAERPCAIPNAAINRIAVDRGRFVVTAWAEQP